MLLKTNGIVLRSVKYGEHSIITTIFTSVQGVQTYMVQGVRSSKTGKNRAGMFQPGMMLELVVYQQSNKNLQRIKEFHASYIYNTLQEDVVKNSVVLFSIELLLRLLPEHAPMPELFEFVHRYLTTLDKMATMNVANFPLFFIIHCSREFGFDMKGSYSKETPYLDLNEGGFTAHLPSQASHISDDDAKALSSLQEVRGYDSLLKVEMNAGMRMKLIDWYIAFLQRHTQHMGSIRSLSVLRTVLH